MKAVILAGGLGTRLRPLTYAVPKALVPLCGKPLISHIVDSMPPWIDTVLIAVNYMRDAIESYFRRLDLPREIIMVEELEPLGTGGALKNVGKHLDETFVAFNGDVVSSIDLNAMVQFHRSSKGIGTVALWKVEDPSAFGAVALGENGRILKFQEKPPKDQALSNLVNAGAYVFEPEILDWIGPGNVSLERQVFPQILTRGIYGHRFGGYWVDCGTRENFLRAQRVLMDEGGRVMVDTELIGDSRVIGPNHLEGVKCLGGRIGPYVSAQRGVVVKEDSEVSDSILMEGVVLERGSRVKGSIVGPGVTIAPSETAADSILALQ